MRKRFFFAYKEHVPAVVAGNNILIYDGEYCNGLEYTATADIWTDHFETAKSDIEEVLERLKKAEETIKTLTEEMSQLKKVLEKK